LRRAAVVAPGSILAVAGSGAAREKVRNFVACRIAFNVRAAILVSVAESGAVETIAAIPDKAIGASAPANVAVG